MPKTYPNQRIVRVHREPARTDFLGIKNDNWQAAARDLSAHALKLYLYLASNANNYEFALSATALLEDIGMARSTYHDQFHVLVSKGYLVQTGGNTYSFYETPQPRPGQKKESTMLGAGYNWEDRTADGQDPTQADQDCTGGDTEINNKYYINNIINSKGFNEKFKF